MAPTTDQILTPPSITIEKMQTTRDMSEQMIEQLSAHNEQINEKLESFLPHLERLLEKNLRANQWIEDQLTTLSTN